MIVPTFKLWLVPLLHQDIKMRRHSALVPSSSCYLWNNFPLSGFLFQNNIKITWVTVTFGNVEQCYLAFTYRNAFMQVCILAQRKKGFSGLQKWWFYYIKPNLNLFQSGCSDSKWKACCKWREICRQVPFYQNRVKIKKHRNICLISDISYQNVMTEEQWARLSNDLKK